MQNKKKLIKAMKKTFFSYLKLDFAREYRLNINGNESSFTDYVQELLEKNILSAENNKHACTIGETDYIIKLKNNKITLSKNPPASSNKTPYKEITEYDENEVCELLSNIPFTLGFDNNNNVSLALPIVVNGNALELGGPIKLPLYRSHLVTLRKMIAHLEEHDDIKAMLVALTTGSGKTFVQGLWYLTLQFAKMRGIFAQPHNLVQQFRGDLKKLLPSELVDELKSADQIEDEPFILSSYETLLDDHFEELYDEEGDSGDLALIFDEQHQVMGDESRRVKLKALATQKLCLFLTATPTKETYKMCDNKPVAVMSAMEKQLEGQGSFPKVVKLRNQPLQKMANTLEMPTLARLSSHITIPLRSVFEGRYNPPTSWTVFDDLRRRVHIKDEAIPNDNSRKYLRQNVEMPGTHKILFITDSTDELINIHNYLTHYSSHLSPYNNGSSEHQTHGPSDKNYQSVVQRHEKLQNEKFKAQLDSLDSRGLLNPNSTKNLGGLISRKPLSPETINQNIVGLFLSCVMGSSPLELYIKAIDNRENLIELVNNKLAPILDKASDFFKAKLSYDAKTNPDGMDENGAALVADLLAKMANTFQGMSEQSKHNFMDNLRGVALNYNLPAKTLYQHMVNLFLSQLTGFSSSELNYHRENDPNKLTELLNKALDPIQDKASDFFEAKLRYDANTNPDGMDENKAAQLADVLADMANTFQGMSEKTKQLFTDNLTGPISHKPPAPLSDQLDKTIYHNMVDLFLGQITGLSPLELNRHREEDLEKLIELVNKKFDPTLHNLSDFFEAKLRYDAETNPNGIDENGAAEVADLLANIADEFQGMSEETKERFIDNWAFDDTVYDTLKNSIQGLSDFAKKHRTMYIMKGKKTAETPIEDDAVFFSFETKEVKVFDENRMLSKEAKKRKRGTFELMDENLKETHYIPMVNPDINETIADNYFKLGLVGMYISNNKWQGFNDINLHTVISTIPSPNDANNAPARMIQTIGRNRGLDPTITPYFIQCFSLNSQSTFDVKLLETSDDYYSLYFKADKKYQKLFVQHLAKIVSAEIKHELYNNPTGALIVNDLQLKWRTLRCVVQALRVLNNKNSHNIKLSRSQLSTVIRLVKQEIAHEIRVLKESSDLPKGIMRAFSLIYTFFSAFTYIKNIPVKFKLFLRTQKSKTALKSAIDDENPLKINKLKAELLYSKILNRRYSKVGAQTIAIQSITSTFVAELSKNEPDGKTAEDQEVFQEKIKAQLKDYIMHPQFHKTVKAIIGSFSESELQFLCNVIQEKDVNLENNDATDLQRLLSLLSDKNYGLIAEEFLNLEDLKLFNNMLPLLRQIQEESETIHKFYLRLLGSRYDTEPDEPALSTQTTGPAFKLQNLLGNKGITALRISTKGNKTFNEIGHDTMTWYPLLSGVNVGSKISALQHSEEIKVLHRINDHILSPLWWSTNKTELGLKLSEAGEAIKSWFTTTKKPEPTDDVEADETEADNSIDSYSTMTKSMDKAEKPSITDAEINKQFNRAAYDTGLQIRKLKQFSLKQVRKPGCKVDTIQKVLDNIDQEENTAKAA